MKTNEKWQEIEKQIYILKSNPNHIFHSTVMDDWLNHAAYHCKCTYFGCPTEKEGDVDETTLDQARWDNLLLKDFDFNEWREICYEEFFPYAMDNFIEKYIPHLAPYVKKWIQDDYLDFKNVDEMIKTYIDSDSWSDVFKEICEPIESEIKQQIKMLVRDPSFKFNLTHEEDTDHYNQIAQELRKKYIEDTITKWESMILEIDDMRDPFGSYLFDEHSSIGKILCDECIWLRDSKNHDLIMTYKK